MARPRTALLSLLILLLALGTLLFAGACDIVYDCGPFKDKFRTTGFTTGTLRVVGADTTSGEPILYFLPVEGDTLARGELAIWMRPTQEFYFSESTGGRPAGSSFSLVPPAFACSPIEPTSDEVIRDIRIYSDEAFDHEFPAGDDLSGLFDVVALRQDQRSVGLSLDEFLRSVPEVALELYLVLNAAPRTTSEFSFTIEYYQEGSGLDYYEFSTDPVVLRSDRPEP